MNEEDGAPNYDPEHKIMRSLFGGSRGPLLAFPPMSTGLARPTPGTIRGRAGLEGRSGFSARATWWT